MLANVEQHSFLGYYVCAAPGVDAGEADSGSGMVPDASRQPLELYPYAPLNLLVIDPHLPEWLPEITIRDLRVGKTKVTIEFKGESWRVREKEGTLHVVQQPMPWSLTARRGERLIDLLRSFVK